jgi:hypothetical protein
MHLSDGFCCVPLHGVRLLNPESKTSYFSFFKVLAALKLLTWKRHPCKYIVAPTTTTNNNN